MTITRKRCLHYGRHDNADRSLDDARDDSGAVNSPSTTLHSAQNDIFMRSSRLHCVSLRMTMRMAREDKEVAILEHVV